LKIRTRLAIRFIKFSLLKKSSVSVKCTFGLRSLRSGNFEGFVQFAFAHNDQPNQEESKDPTTSEEYPLNHRLNPLEKLVMLHKDHATDVPRLRRGGETRGLRHSQ